MLDGWASKMALGYLAAGPAVNEAARLTATARQHATEVALQIANNDRGHLYEQLNEVSLYADALAAENFALRQSNASLHRQNVALQQDGAVTQKYAADLKAWGERLREELAEARQIIQHNAISSELRRCLARLQGG